MQVTVGNNFLNVRASAPSVNAPNNIFLSPGQVLEIDGQLYKGDIYEDIDLWIKDLAGNYVWSGGVTGLYPDWMINLKIPCLWHYATGNGIGVAVVDTGLDVKNLELPYNTSTYFLYNTGAQLQDTVGHGTHCAGLIAARNKNGNILGTAPNCNLFISKLSDTSSLDDPLTERYADAINWCANQNEIHVISISWASVIFDQSVLTAIQDAINLAVQKNKIVVCAMGDASSFNDPGPLYPASLSNTIGIGALPEANLFTYINGSLDCVIDGFNIPSYGLNQQVVHMSGTSQSNAIIAGVIALVLEKSNLSLKTADIKSLLKRCSVQKSFTSGSNTITLPVLDSGLLFNYFKT